MPRSPRSFSVGFRSVMEMTRQPANPWKALFGRTVIAPSLLACDFVRAGEQIDQAIEAGAEVLHVDVMDGHFVGNLSMGPGFVQKVRRYTDHPLDVHLMVTDPGYYLERFAEAGADSITFHVEATDRPGELIERLRALGLGAGISLKPGTGFRTIEEIIPAVDMVLVMTVEPGYGGQEFIGEMPEKIAQIRSLLRPAQRLEVDGGITPQTVGRCFAAGADVFVAGENIFGSGNIAAAIDALRSSARSAGGQ
jgi:ribulose-phosphate 3-epimerase